MDPLEKNTEINNALNEFNLEQQKEKKTKPSIVDPSEIAQKAKEAFREFQMKKRAEIGVEQPTINGIHLTSPEQEKIIITEKDTEINKALQEFQIKTAQEELLKPKEEQSETKGSGMTQLVIKYSGGLVKNKYQANYVLLGIIVIAFILSGYFFYIGLGGKVPKTRANPPMVNELDLEK